MTFLYRALFLFFLILPGSVASFAVADTLEQQPGLSEAALVDVGRQIYQQGLMADGTPVKALVLGDVEVSGDQFTCINCHRRSGMGGPEGRKIVLSTNGASLLAPRVALYMPRPAYTYSTFAESMALGVNPNGDPFDQIMPVYDLPELEMKALFAYLLQLSSQASPGVTEEDLHIATVVSEDADPGLRQEMMTILNTFFTNKNALSRNQEKLRRVGPFYREFRNKAYRRWVLHTWELSGPAESWPAQLEEHYREQPVFVMVSGLVSGRWDPVHEFCRDKKLPCLLPNTDLPVVEESTDFYTLYFSKGLTLEAELFEAGLSGQKDVDRVLQISRKGHAGERGVEILDGMLLQDKMTTENITLESGEINWGAIRQQFERFQPEAIVLWLDESDLKLAAAELDPVALELPVYLSSSLLQGDLGLVPSVFKKRGQAAHPFLLPEEQKYHFAIPGAWFRANKIPLTSKRIQEQTYFSCLMLQSSTKHIKTNFYRDYLLDMLDHASNMASYSGSYPRLSFGPEQRFLAKGAYLVDLNSEEARWVIPGQ